jgi:hypothetical protein
LAEHLPRIAAQAVYTVGLIDDKNTTAEMLEEVLNLTCKLAEEALKDHTRLKMDRKINKTTKIVTVDCKDSSGSTAVLCIVSKKYLAVGNVGDSRALLAQINHKYIKPKDISEGNHLFAYLSYVNFHVLIFFTCLYMHICLGIITHDYYISCELNRSVKKSPGRRKLVFNGM